MAEDRKFDAVIAGGGYAGLALALALERSLGSDMSIVVLDRSDGEGAASTGSPSQDPRAVAISASSRHLLDALGVWTTIAPDAEPVRRIEITDSSLDAGIRPVLLAWDNAMEEVSGPSTAAHIVPLPVLSAALASAAAAAPGIEIRHGADVTTLSTDAYLARITLAGGETFSAPVAVAADGRNSIIRDAAGIKTVGWPYAQVGIATTVSHALDHGGVAVQHFLPAGPFAILPLPGKRSCVTWTETEAEGRRIMALDDARFLDELDLRFGGRLGELTLDGGRRAWPLSLHISRSYVGNRVALIGDAAHAVHPIAGQGLNLAFRDVAALTEVIADAARTGLDIGDASILEQYERWRRFDSFQAAASFDAVNRLFSRDGRLLRSVRELGLQIVDRMPALKRAFVGEAAGLTGKVPKLLKGELA